MLVNLHWNSAFGCDCEFSINTIIIGYDWIPYLISNAKKNVHLAFGCDWEFLINTIIISYDWIPNLIWNANKIVQFNNHLHMDPVYCIPDIREDALPRHEEVTFPNAVPELDEIRQRREEVH